MIMQKKNLIDSLTIARMGVAGSDHLEQLGHFIFGGEHLITFNNRILIYHPFETEFQCSVRADLFYKQLQKFSTPDLDISLKRKKIVIEGKREKAQMSVQMEKDSEIFEIIDSIREEQKECQYITVPEDFIKAVEFCSYSASKNAADGTLCCVCIEGDKIVATDNYRATRYEMDKEMTLEKVLLDARVANEIKRFNMTHFGTGTNWLHFKNKEGVLLSARRIFGDYPDITSAFDFAGKRLFLPEKNVMEILDFVGVLLADEQELERKATIEVKDGLISAFVDRTTESAEKAVELDVENHPDYQELEMKFIVNIEFLKSVLQKTNKMVYNLEEGKGMFRDKNFQHVIRLAPEEETQPPVKDVSVGKEELKKEPVQIPDEDIPF